jgi:tryptophan synthase beta subunit
MKVAPEMTDEQIMIVNLSGRGDKDIDTVRTKITTEDTKEETSPAPR